MQQIDKSSVVIVIVLGNTNINLLLVMDVASVEALTLGLLTNRTFFIE